MAYDVIYNTENFTLPKRVNVKRLNAEFLNEFVFLGQYPVETKYSRSAIDLPVGIYVSNDHNTLKPMGFDYLGGSPTIYPGGEMSIDYGAVASGIVEIDVVATHPDLRDSVLGEIYAAYFSHEGRCWFFNSENVNVHGYVPVACDEMEFEQTLDGQVNFLYLASLTLRFEYDIYMTVNYQPISEITEWKVVVMDPTYL